jgi:hypothetical protein
MTPLTELEERLDAPEGDALRTQLIRQLDETALRLRARLARPLPRDEFASVSGCLNAVQAAQAVLGQWITGAARFTPATSGAVARR